MYSEGSKSVLTCAGYCPKWVRRDTPQLPHGNSTHAPGHRVAVLSCLLWSADISDFTERRPSPGPDTVAALLERVRAAGPRAVLGRWDQADGLRARVGFLRKHRGNAWPDWSDAALTASLEEWLAPMLGQATGRGHLNAVDVAGALALTLGWDTQMELARLAPKTVTVPSGAEIKVNYEADPPALAVRIGEMFGSTITPTVLDGDLPLRLELLNPAGRPVQVTSDLAGFWEGTWAQVRSELRGRYPKHDWPEHPGTARPRRR